MTGMRSFRAFFLASACAAALASSAGPTWAQPTQQQLSEARTLANQGRSALLQKKFADAIDPLRQAVAIDPSPQIKLDLARALDGAGKLVEASTILHELEASPDKQIQASAKGLVAEIEGRIPWIMVKVHGPKEGEATILIDGKETDASFEVPIDPGDHVVRAEAEGWKPSEKQASLGNGEHLELELSLERDPSAASEEEEEEEKPAVVAPPPSAWPRPNLPVMIALGTGAAGVAIGSLFGILAFTSTSSAKERCSGNICPNDSETADARDAAIRNGNVSTAGFIIGGLGVGTAAVLYYMTQMKAAPAAAPQKESATIHPWIGPGQAGVFGTF